jgi:hypothetical protein
MRSSDNWSGIVRWWWCSRVVFAWWRLWRSLEIGGEKLYRTGGENGLEGSRTESCEVYSCAPSGLALNDWMVRENNATAVTSAGVSLWSQNQGHARFDKDRAVTFPATPDPMIVVGDTLSLASRPFTICDSNVHLKKDAFDATLHELDA